MAVTGALAANNVVRKHPAYDSVLKHLVRRPFGEGYVPTAIVHNALDSINLICLRCDLGEERQRRLTRIDCARARANTTLFRSYSIA